MTQKQLILEYIKEYGRIMPAKMAGEVYKGEMFGSETSKRCRELRKVGILEGFREGKFEVFKLKPMTTVEPVVNSKPKVGLPLSYPPLAENHKRWTQ